MPVDLNADLGESFGRWALGDDERLVEQITSANVACGFHAGDFIVMDRTVALCRRAGVAVGAQPGYPDLLGFGRRAMAFEPAEVESMVRYQIGALDAFCRAHGVELHHVKPHGALYNQAAGDPALAAAIATATARFSRSLPLYGLASFAADGPSRRRCRHPVRSGGVRRSALSARRVPPAAVRARFRDLGSYRGRRPGGIDRCGWCRDGRGRLACRDPRRDHLLPR